MNLKNISLFFRENYSKVFFYLKESEKFIVFSILFFGVFFIAGLLVRVPETFYNLIMGYIENLIKQTEGLGFFGMFEFIFFNNAWVGFLSIILGNFFGVFPLLSIITNGFVLGFVSNISISSGGFFSLWRILPHGIFELPAIFICFGLGLKMGSFVFHKDFFRKFKEFFVESMRVFLFLIIPLLFMAGIIESFLITFF
jgi:stage II sporulation protein M